MLIRDELGSKPHGLRELASAGEPLNPEVIEQVEKAWGRVIRDGYGQTETTAMIGNSPGQKVKSGSMGRPLPGYQIAVVDLNDKACSEGEVGVRLEPRPAGLMTGYMDDPARTQAAVQDRPLPYGRSGLRGRISSRLTRLSEDKEAEAVCFRSNHL
jgi:acetyl-CoA synthetase